jgi:hypothetical protein
MDARLGRLVRQRADDVCEYCGLRQEQDPLPFHVEHILPRQHGGADTPDNLALAWHHCNLHKGPNLAGLDPETGQLTRLFDPRADRWEEHFARFGNEIVSSTAIGWTTVEVLRMNEDGRAELRAA